MTLERREKPAIARQATAVVLVIGILAVLLLTWRFVRHRMLYAVTDAVFVGTDSLTTVGFDRVSGRVKALTKTEGDSVKKGEVLGKLDDTPFRLEVEQTRARLEAAKRRMRAKRLALSLMEKEVRLNIARAREAVLELKGEKRSIEAKIKASGARIRQMELDHKRYLRLLEQGLVPRRRFEEIETALTVEREQKKALAAGLDAIQARIEQAGKRLELAKSATIKIKAAKEEIEGLEQETKGLEAALSSARDKLEKCLLLSPISGRVAKRFMAPGSVTSPQRVVYALVDPKDLYVIVLLEENKLHGVAPGARASIRIDAYPDKEFQGEVEAVLPASAATFALAPRDISAGEFTKVAQRIPVRIKITNGETSLLRVGLGGEVEIKRISNRPQS